MPLEDSCKQHIDKLVFVLPIIGFGWCLIDPQKSSEKPENAIDPPSPFYMRLVEFHYFAGQIAAGIGIVDASTHPLDKKWGAFCIRDQGADQYNLTTNPGKYNVRIGKTKPTIQIDENLPMPQWMRFEGTWIASGLGYIAESENQIKDKYEWLKKKVN